MRKKILFVTHYSDLYGANKSLLFLIADLIKRYDIEALVLAPHKGPFTDELDDLKIEYTVIKYYPWQEENSSWKSLIKLLVNYINCLVLSIKINKLKIELIHSNSSVIDIGANLAKKLDIPHIWHIREFGKEDYNLKFMLGEHFARKKFEKSQLVIAISNSIKEKYIQLFPKASIKVIHNGVAFDHNYTKNFNFDKPLNFCIVGLIQENKNQLEAVKACGKLIESGIFNFKLSLIGDGSVDYYENIKSYVKEKKLDSHIEFLGYKKNVQEVLQAMDVGIMTSKKEAFGRTTVEYMAAKMPVIGANTGGTKELINNSNDGYLYELGNIDQLAGYMEKFITDRYLVESFGEKGFESAKNNFSIDINTDNIYTTYCEMKI